jgi:hypothetical protein
MKEITPKSLKVIIFPDFSRLYQLSRIIHPEPGLHIEDANFPIDSILTAGLRFDTREKLIFHDMMMNHIVTELEAKVQSLKNESQCLSMHL